MSRNIAYIGHALHAMRERGIEQGWIEATVRQPEVVRPDPSRPGRVLAFRRIVEFGNRWLRVVYEIEEDVVVITAFFDQGMKT